MSLKDTFKHLKMLLAEVSSDLEKSENGNKAAAQRVRTGTIKLEKIAKLFRKESIKSEKSGSFKKPKKSAAPAKSAGKKGKGDKGKAAPTPIAKKSAPKAAPKSSKGAASKSKSVPIHKKATAKIIKKK